MTQVIRPLPVHLLSLGGIKAPPRLAIDALREAIAEELHLLADLDEPNSSARTQEAHHDRENVASGSRR